jgi:hypothetical protein
MTAVLVFHAGFITRTTWQADLPTRLVPAHTWEGRLIPLTTRHKDFIYKHSFI